MFLRITLVCNLLSLNIDFSIRPKEMSHAVGPFTNSLSMRFEVQVEQGFNQLLQRVDSKLRLAAENRGELHMNGNIYLTATVYDLWLGVMERQGTLEINFGYADELLAEDPIQRWAACVHELPGELTSRRVDKNFGAHISADVKLEQIGRRQRTGTCRSAY